MPTKPIVEHVPLQMTEKTLRQFTPEEQYLLRPQKSVVQNMEAVIKFHRNKREKSSQKNPWISLTLNKVAVIDKNWLARNPDEINEMDWWRVKIENETSPGLPVGCLIVRPLWKVERSSLAVFVHPSFWTQVQKGLTVLLYPKKKPWLPWIVPKPLRRMVMQKTGGSALVIPLSYPQEGEPDQSHREGSLDMPVSDLWNMDKDNPGILYPLDEEDDA